MDTATGVKTCRECPFLNEAHAYEWNAYSCYYSDEVNNEMSSTQITKEVASNCPLKEGPITVVYVGNDT